MRRFGILRGAGSLALGMVVWGCASPPPAQSGAAAMPSTTSYDGHYEGVLQLDQQVQAIAGKPQCATDAQLSLQVTNDQFTYVLTHPNAVGTSPALTAQATTVTYTATIAPDGSISGNGNMSVDGMPSLVGTITGHVSGTHMTGQIEGLLCAYTFTADRV